MCHICNTFSTFPIVVHFYIYKYIKLNIKNLQIIVMEYIIIHVIAMYHTLCAMDLANNNKHILET